MINSYQFGKVIIDHKEYYSDIIIYKDKVNDNWWRKEGHNLCIEDIREILNKKPEILIIGTGAYGLMKVSLELMKHLEKINIKVIEKKTIEACEEYNRLYLDKNVVAALHLTC